MTLAANLATSGPGWWGAAVAVWPAVAFLAVAGLFETRVRRDREPGQADRRLEVQTSGLLDVSPEGDGRRGLALAGEPGPVPVAVRPGTAVPVAVGPGRDRDRAAMSPGPRRSRTGTGTGTGSAAVERMRAYWAGERDAGRTPTGVELARLTGTDSSFGRRVRRQLLEEAELSGRAERAGDGGREAGDAA